MLPGDKVYRTIETNSLKICEEQCANERETCQAFAIGISAIGNGTCQLSMEAANDSGDRRPKGTVYDPSFDIYNRKQNCIPVDDNLIPSGGNLFAHFFFNLFVQQF